MKKGFMLMAGVMILLFAGCQTNEEVIFVKPPITGNSEPTVSINQTGESVVFFKQAWMDKLQGSEIISDRFVTSDGTEVPVEMMTKKMEILNTSGNEYFEILEVPYEDGTFSMTVFIPKNGISLDKAESELTMRNMAKWDASLVKSVQEIALPRFMIDPEKELVFAEADGRDKMAPSVMNASSFTAFKMNRPFFFVIRPIISGLATNNSRSVVFTGKVGIAMKYKY